MGYIQHSHSITVNKPKCWRKRLEMFKIKYRLRSLLEQANREAERQTANYARRSR
jgi:hypothetical protein